MVNKVSYISSATCGLCKQIRPLVEKISLENGVPVEWVDAGAVPQEYVGAIKDAMIDVLPIILVFTENGIKAFGRGEHSKLDIKEFEKVIKNG